MIVENISDQIFVFSAAINVSRSCSLTKPKIPPAALEIIAFSLVARKEMLPEDMTDHVTPLENTGVY